MIVEALADALGMRTAGLDVLSEELASRNAFPLEVLRKGLQVFLAAGAGRSHQENTSHLLHLDLLKNELHGVLGTGHDKLLKQILEKLVNLVLVQVLLNRLHVVELLHFLHFRFQIL